MYTTMHILDQLSIIIHQFLIIPGGQQLSLILTKIFETTKKKCTVTMQDIRYIILFFEKIKDLHKSIL